MSYITNIRQIVIAKGNLQDIVYRQSHILRVEPLCDTIYNIRRRPTAIMVFVQNIISGGTYMKKMLSYGLVGLSLLGITVGAVIPTTAMGAKTEIATAICDTVNRTNCTQDALSALNSSDIKNLMEKYGCSMEDLENIAAECVGDTGSEGATDTDCNDNSLLESIKDKLSQGKGNCNTNTDSKNDVSDSKTTVTENTDKSCLTENKTTATESQDKNSVSAYVEKAKELLENKSNVKADDVKEFCDSVNNSSNKKTICSVLDSEELRNLLKRFGFSFDYNQNSTVPTTSNTEPTDKTQPTTGNNNSNNNNSNSNSGNHNQTTKPTSDKNSSSVSEYEKRVVELVNEIRAENGLSKLTLNTELSAVARLKSQDMKDKHYFSHTSPTYGSPFDMMKQFGISYRTAGENIAYGYSTPEAVVDGWMNSPGHRANILNSSYKEIGVGYVASGHYWTQMFIG